ncbi:MAG: hypothetical protein J1F20_03415 [Muribaculaceae bacterium]|nr:hypothetical protein [Muribaculaceae bacterium]
MKKKNIILSVALACVSLFAFAESKKMVQIFKNGEVVQQFAVEDVDYIEVNDVDVADIPSGETPDPNAVNLSSEGTANCYIVTPGTKVVFNAQYKGNSTTEEIGAPTQATILWQTAPDLVADVKYYPSVKQIEATVAAKEGNALVAAKDANGKILWSWHLWIINYDPTNEYTTPANANGTTWTFMDRNLGALSTDREGMDSHGLFYQWGRKDPFPGAATKTIMNEDYTYEVDGEPTLYDGEGNVLPKFNSFADSHGTLALSIENPMAFYVNLSVTTDELDEYGYPIVRDDWLNGDWVKESNDDYWGGVSMKKSIYDPSPVGYKVPVSDLQGATPYDWLTYADMTWDSVNEGAEQNGQWFPATGTRVYASGSLDFPANGNPYCGLWFGTKGTESSNLEEYPTIYGQYMMIVNGKRTFKTGKDRRSQGLSVRCVRE